MIICRFYNLTFIKTLSLWEVLGEDSNRSAMPPIEVRAFQGEVNAKCCQCRLRMWEAGDKYRKHQAINFFHLIGHSSFSKFIFFLFSFHFLPARSPFHPNSP